MGSVVAIPITVGLNLLSARPSDITTFCKWIISFSYIEYCRRTIKRRFDLYDMEAKHDPEKCNFLPPQIEYDLESPQPESKLLHSADEVFFYGVNSSSECLITRIARTADDEAEAWIYLKLKEGKIYRLRETSGYQNSCRDNREFTCGGLRVNYITPMRQWRIFFNGILRETSETDETIDRMVYVKFALIWRASSDCFDATTDVNSAALAKGFARSKWKTMIPGLKEFNDTFNFYAQSGSFMGTVQVDENTEERIFNVFGEKTRFLGNTTLKNGATFTHLLGQISETGAIFHITEATIPDVVDRLKLGFMVFSSGVVEPISDADILTEASSSEGCDTKANFYADGLEFKVKANFLGKTAHFESKKGWDGSLTIDVLQFRMNDELDGRGVLMKGKILQTSQRRIFKENINKLPKVVPMAVQFSENVCEISEVTGGKGSSLGKLTQLSKELQNFIVPNGMVVTTSAYEEFLNENIRKGIKNLENVLYGNTAGDVKAACQRVMEEVIKTKMPDQVLQAIEACLKKVFGDNLHTKKFAVRSSATGEDTEQMSAAGQMDTYLGITGLNEIMSAVKKCWASQFGFIAVQYKRQNGQIINCPMAVVIQEMVSCDVAGVLFTCDPLTGNPTLMSITANYGLGESVVSGSEEPDTVMLSRSADDQLEIKEKIIGAKSRRIVIKEDEGTTLEDVSEQEKNSCCLSDSMILRLGNIAVQIEKSYRSNRDIEWGFWNNNLYIFQSRPVTSGTGETDFEIDHEADAPMRMENDYFTVCNVGEVLPGAISPLGMDTMIKYFRITLQRKIPFSWQSRIRPAYFPKNVANMYRHIMIYLIDLLERANEGRGVLQATMVGLFGRVIEDETLFSMAMERYSRAKSPSIIMKNYILLRVLLSPARRLKQALKTYAHYHIPLENLRNSREIFDALMHSCDDLHEAFLAHMIATQASSIWNMIVLNILQKEKGGMSSEVYRDFSKLLSAIDEVESADVPSALQSLAYHIGKDINSADFKKMSCEEISQWLNTSPTEAGIKYRDFLTKHGHRCLKEFDLRSTTWGANPSLLIELLKNLVGNVQDSTAKKQENSDQILIDMNLGYIKRIAVKFLLPRCRRAVQNREATKSLLMKGMDEWRKAYWHLAKTMVSEGRIPDADLLFFMTVEDIKEILSTRSPKIISRANHRRRRHPVLDKYIFPEISMGFPQPVNLNNTPITPAEDNFMMKGIPVSQGVAKGYVRVALTLEEASHLKPGEILLTYSTDIGWTPYFPALAGVVTELGGLISHGAVVSREYGLPCIAGLHGATRQFQTGDFVLLDGNKGILQKISPPEP